MKKHASKSTILTGSFIMGAFALYMSLKGIIDGGDFDLTLVQADYIALFLGNLFIAVQRFRKSHSELHF